MKQMYRYVMLLMGFFIVTSQLAIAEEMKIFGNESKPPKYYLDEGVPKGILIDIMKYVDAQMETSFDYKLYPWKRAYKNALKAQGAVIGLSKTEERLKIFDYSDVMYYDTLVLVVLKGKEFDYKKIEDLKGKKLGVQRGSNYGSAFAKAKDSLTLSLDGSGEQRLLKLLKGRIDVALLGPGKMGVDAIIASDKTLSDKKDQFVILETPFKNDPNYLGCAKEMNKKDFIEKFNVIIKKGYASGDIQKIIKSHATPSK